MNTDANHETLGSHGIERVEVSAVNAPERLALFKPREKIFPKLVHGTFRKVKWLAMAVTLGIYYVTPWLRWDRGPGTPDQAVLIDFPGRRFYFFFIELWPQEVYYFTGLLVIAAVGLFLVTALAGRAWCGYACPQTIWTDLFVHVERLVEGDRNERIRLDRAPWSLPKLAKRVLKHGIWLMIAVATGGAWVFYFADAPTLAHQLVSLSAAPVAYISIAVLTATTYVLGGLAREQVCIYMCPWPRIQSAMLDEHSLIVTYRRDRGEPRGAHKKGDTWDGRGDCVECRQCVAACPTGIDIRDGLQLACIQCALCIDACDDIMTKVGRPKGLIGYDTDINIVRRQQGQKPVFRPVRIRTIAYAVIIAITGAIMMTALLSRGTFSISVQHERNPTFVMLSNGDVRNAYTVNIANKARIGRSIEIVLDGLRAATLTGVGVVETQRGVRVAVDPDDLRGVRLMVTLPGDQVTGAPIPMRFVASVAGDDREMIVESMFLGPGAEK